MHLANPLEARVLQIISYDEDGNVVRNYTGTYEWTSLRHGSILYVTANAAMHYVQ